MLSFNLPSSAVKKHKKGFSWLDTGPDKKWSHKFIELVVFTLIVPVIGFFFFKNDPVGMNSGFPWIVLKKEKSDDRYNQGKYNRLNKLMGPFFIRSRIEPGKSLFVFLNSRRWQIETEHYLYAPLTVD